MRLLNYCVLSALSLKTLGWYYNIFTEVWGMEKKNKMEIKINGIEYTVVSDDPLEYIQRIAICVDQKMSAISNANPRLSTAMSAVLTAINLADDYCKLSDIYEELNKRIQKENDDYEMIKLENKDLEQENEMLKEEIQQLKIELAEKEGRLSK